MLRTLLLCFLSAAAPLSVIAQVVTPSNYKAPTTTLKKKKKKKKSVSAWRNLPQHVQIPSMDESDKKPRILPAKAPAPPRKPGGFALPSAPIPPAPSAPPSAEEMEMMQAINDVFTAAALGGGFDAIFGG